MLTCFGSGEPETSAVLQPMHTAGLCRPVVSDEQISNALAVIAPLRVDRSCNRSKGIGRKLDG